MFIADYKELVRFSAEKMQKVNLFESHRMFADLYCLLPEQSQKPHTHDDNDKLYFVLEGECLFLVGDQERLLTSGQACVAPAGAPHGVRNNSNDKAVVLVCMAPHVSMKKESANMPTTIHQ